MALELSRNQLLYLIIHGGLHHWNKLKWLVDIKDLLQRFPLNELLFFNLTKELKAHRLVAVCNELLKVYLPGFRLLPCTNKAPQHLLQFSLQQINRTENKDAKTIRNFTAIFRNSLGAFPGFRYKISIIGHVLFATDLAEKNGYHVLLLHITWLTHSVN